MKRKFKSVVSIVLSVMMIISMASIGIITTNAASTAKIYFDKSNSNWNSVYIWAWNDSVNQFTKNQWPGDAMTDDGNNIYSYDLDTNAKYVIISDNGSNSSRIQSTLPDAWTTKEKVFKSDGSSYNKDGSEDAPDIKAGERIYFDNSISKWTNVYIYLWKGTENSDKNNENFGSESNITTPMTRIDNSDIWSYSFKNDYSGKIIFRGNTGSEWNPQTDGIALSERGSNNCVKPTKVGNKPTTEWTSYAEVSEPHKVTINGNIKVTATADGKTNVINATGDSKTEDSMEVTASTLTLTAEPVGYSFAGWKLGEGATITSGSVSKKTITVNVTADTTITATSLTMTPRLSVNSGVANNLTATVKPGDTFTLNALSKVGDKNREATNYTVDFYKYTDNIDNAQHIGEQIKFNVSEAEYTELDQYKNEQGEIDPPEGKYLIGDKHPAVLNWTETTPGAYHYYAVIKGLDNNGNTITGEGATQYLSSSYIKDEVTVTVAEPFNKANAYGSGCLWVDVQPSVTDSSIALIKWTNKTGSNGTSSDYTLYVPGGIKLNEMPIYSKINNLKINNESVAQGGTYNFTHGGSYTVTGDGVNCTLKVYQSKSDSMFTTTVLTNEADKNKAKDGDNLPTQSYGSQIDKVEYNGHFMSITASDGKKCDDVDIEKIKGRGNSSWKASGEVYGKYAYNVKFTSKIQPLKMKEATKAKSWCLLANNMDESGLRNAVTFETAKLAGLSNVPEYKVADLYNNGEYLGSYLITEKVDVGGSKLVDGDTAEDYYTGGTGNQLNATLSYDGNNIEYHYVDTGSLKVKSTAEDGTPTYYTAKDFSYLLEFDLRDRAKEEHCWFKTPNEQYVVVKAPEDLNKNEMEFIIKKWLDAEKAVYSKDANKYEQMNNLMNLDSFADVYLVQEFTKNLDSCATSYFVYWDGTSSKTGDGSDVKWEATPIWDYDWALGGYWKTKYLINNPGAESSNTPETAEGWYAKYKCVVGSDVDKPIEVYQNTCNLQAELANNTEFWNNNVVNAWNSDFYDSINAVFSDNGYINTLYGDSKASFDMNENRYSFIKRNPTGTKPDGWGSVDTGATVQACYEYLLKWGKDRAIWMNDRIGETVTVSLDADKTEIQTGDSVTLTADLSRGKSTYPMTYQYYMSTDGTNYTPIGDATTESTFKTDALTAAGTYRFKVCAMYSTYTKAESEVVVEVTGASAQLTGVSLSAPTSAVTGASITLKATPVFEGNVTGITYSYYMSADNIEGDDTLIRANTTLTSYTTKAPDTAGKYYYYVKATFGETTKTSSLVPVEVTEQQGSHPVKVWFKSSSGNAYIPSVSLDGGSYQEMTSVKMGEENSTYIGSTLSGSLKFYWFYADITIDSTSTHTLTFRTAGTSVRATSEPDYFNGTEYHFAVDNLVQDTTLVNLTGKDPYIKNFHRSATHMVYSGIVPGESSLGFTFVDGVEYPMGKYVDKPAARSLQASVLAQQLGKFDVPSSSSVGARFAPFNIDSATLVQKFVASIEDISELQWCLLDVNLDGQVDIMDATLMQKALAQ